MKQKEEFRHAFLDEAFGIKYDSAGIPISKPEAKVSSKMYTKEDYERKIEILEKWDIAQHSDGTTKFQYRQANHIGHTLKKMFVVVQNGLGHKTLHRIEKSTSHLSDSSLRIAVHQEQVFDVIYEAHQQVGHKKATVTHNRVKSRYYNISEDLVKIFCKMCPTCIHKRPKTAKFRGAQQPIESWSYRDRSQADLVDYRSDPQLLIPRDPNSPVCQWLLVVKDHFARTVYTRPITKKCPFIVGYELTQFFSFAGYPLILHTDNGSEFGNDVLREMKKLNPQMICVTGRVRTPRDQGSVERANQDIKEIIASRVFDARQSCKTDIEKTYIAWTTEAAAAARSMNASYSRGTGNVEPYELVFHHKYHAPMVESLMMLQDFDCPETLEELSQHLSLEYTAKLRSLGYLGDEEPDLLGHDSIQQPSSERCLHKSDPLLIARENMAKLSGTKAPDDSVSTEKKPSPPSNSSSQKDPPLALSSLKKPPPATSSTQHGSSKNSDEKKIPAAVDGDGQKLPPGESVESLSPPLKVIQAMAELPLDDQVLSPPQIPKKLFHGLGKVKQEPLVLPSTKQTNLSPTEALQLKSHLDFIVARLGCSFCEPKQTCQLASVAIYQAHIVQELRNTEEWFTTQFVASFANLLKHRYHNTEVELVHVQYPESLILPKDVTPVERATKQLLVYAHRNSHYVVLLVDIENKTAMVHDGLHRPVSNWAQHLFWTLQKVGLVQLGTKLRKCIDASNPDGTPYKFRASIPWKMMYNPLLPPQRDSSSCGPIACVTMWHYLSGKQYQPPMDVSTMRKSVCDEYMAMRTQFEGTGSLRYRRGEIVVNMVNDVPNVANKVVSLEEIDSSSIEDGDNAVDGLADDDDTSTKKRSRPEPTVEDAEDAKCPPPPPSKQAKTPQSIKSAHAEQRSTQPSAHVSCVICMDDEGILSSSLLVLTCKHQAHVDCLMQWASLSNICHMCRAPIPSDIMKVAQKLAKAKQQKEQAEATDMLVDVRNASVDRQKRLKMLLDAKGRERQAKQAASMRKRYVNTRNLNQGDIVSILVPKEVRARTTNLHLLGVVASVSKTASVSVVVSGGIISEKEKVHWLSPDKVERQWDSASYALPLELGVYRSQILSKQFDPAKVPKISLAEAHRRLVDVKNQGMNRCKCKKGQCRNCVCARNNTLCYSGCGCAGRCPRTLQLSEDLKSSAGNASAAGS